MIPVPLASALRRDLARTEAKIRAADNRGDDRAAFEESCRADDILAEIAAVEGISTIGLVTQQLPAEMLV